MATISPAIPKPQYALLLRYDFPLVRSMYHINSVIYTRITYSETKQIRNGATHQYTICPETEPARHVNGIPIP